MKRITKDQKRRLETKISLAVGATKGNVPVGMVYEIIDELGIETEFTNKQILSMIKTAKDGYGY